MLKVLGGTSPRLFVILDDTGSGKSTVLGRIAYDLAAHGYPVFELGLHATLNYKSVRDVVRFARKKVVLVVDGLATNADSVLQILNDPSMASKCVVLSADRTYRRVHIDRVLGSLKRETVSLQGPSEAEYSHLIEIYRKQGLIGAQGAIGDPMRFARKLIHDPYAIAVCRIMNDFRPLDSIIDSLLNESSDVFKYSILCVAVAHYCTSSGIRYNILLAAEQNRVELDSLFSESAPLGIMPSVEDDNYVVPVNPSMLERVLFRVQEVDSKLLFDVFVGIASALSPYVNRGAIKSRTHEARLAGRLFDADKVVGPLLRERGDQFYADVHEAWEWNSRYWEQRALLAEAHDLEIAIGYARHAVSIEQHAFPFTTLGKLLLRSADQKEGSEARYCFSEAFDLLSRAIEFEKKWSRTSIQPYATLLNGTLAYLDRNGKTSSNQRRALEGFCREVFMQFSQEHALCETAESVIIHLERMGDASR